MIVYKYTFKDLTIEERQQLVKFMVESKIQHDLEIYERSDEEWDDTTKLLYKAYKKAGNAFKTRLFKLKHNIK